MTNGLQVVICSKFITFADKYNTINLWFTSESLWFAQNSLPLRWQIQRIRCFLSRVICCDLLKIHYLCGDKYNALKSEINGRLLWFAQNSLPLRWQIQQSRMNDKRSASCDLLKIHYLCGDKYNPSTAFATFRCVVICSKFITFAVTNTTSSQDRVPDNMLWFAQNSLPLRWQIQP